MGRMVPARGRRARSGLGGALGGRAWSVSAAGELDVGVGFLGLARHADLGRGGDDAILVALEVERVALTVLAGRRWFDEVARVVKRPPGLGGLGILLEDAGGVEDRLQLGLG